VARDLAHRRHHGVAEPRASGLGGGFARHGRDLLHHAGALVRKAILAGGRRGVHHPSREDASKQPGEHEMLRGKYALVRHDQAGEQL
jgi:hypothetical protein